MTTIRDNSDMYLTKNDVQSETINTPKEDNILYLSRKDVELACADLDSVAPIRDLFKLHGSGQTILPDEAYLGWANDRGEQVRSLNMPGYVGGSLNSAGTKIINANIANPQRGLPRASGITCVMIRPRCVLIALWKGHICQVCVQHVSQHSPQSFLREETLRVLL